MLFGVILFYGLGRFGQAYMWEKAGFNGKRRILGGLYMTRWIVMAGFPNLVCSEPWIFNSWRNNSIVIFVKIT